MGADFEPFVYEALKREVTPGDVVVDVGANLGVYSMLFARWVGASGRVYAFEPAPESRAVLSQHLALNGVSDRVEVIGDAVSDEAGKATFFAAGCSGESSLHPGVLEHTPGAKAIQVPVTTLDAFCLGRNVSPALVKIDIEGYELQAIRGAQTIVQRCSPTFLVELHPRAWAQRGQRWEDLACLLTELGYESSPLTEANDSPNGCGHTLLRRRNA
jgi:FkbM family methyltransferase